VNREWRTDIPTRKSTGAKKAPAAAKSRASKPGASKSNASKSSASKAGSAKVSASKPASKKASPALLKHVLKSLDDDKAEDVVTIDLEGRSSLTDALVIATGRSTRHVASIAEHLARKLKDEGYGTRPVDGAAQGDWVLVDAGDVIVHVFRAEVRDYYDLEGMWSVEEPKKRAAR
jgi:ribosome-associated protein